MAPGTILASNTLKTDLPSKRGDPNLKKTESSGS